MICITLFGGAEFCITDENRMMIRRQVRGEVVAEIDLGPAKEKHLDTVLLHMGSLRIHTVRGE